MEICRHFNILRALVIHSFNQSVIKTSLSADTSVDTKRSVHNYSNDSNVG